MWRLMIFQENCMPLSYPTEASILLPPSSSKFSRNALTLWKFGILTTVQSTKAVPTNTNSGNVARQDQIQKPKSSQARTDQIRQLLQYGQASQGNKQSNSLRAINRLFYPQEL